ncbi:MAG: gamma-glutamyl-phosphate reductase, partial [Sphingomonas sp.]
MLDPLSPSALIADLATKARAAQRMLSRTSTEERRAGVRQVGQALRAASEDILHANRQDVARAEAAGLSGAMLDRLRLDPARVAAMADAVEAVAGLPDPVGQII